jgi:multidrug efflux pump subunit AcrA (membrane-fusion protein)
LKALISRCFSIALLALLPGCGRAPTAAPASSAPPPNISVIKPIHQEADQSITLPGDAVGFYECALHSKVTGYLQSIPVDKGDWVKKGQVLATLEIPELRENLERAKATSAIQKLTYQRLKHVHDEDPKVVAQQDVDIAYSKMAQAQADLGVLNAMVSYTQITAPFDGVITGRFADPGALIRAGGGDIGASSNGADISSAATEGAGGHMSGGPVLTMARIDKLRIYVYVPEEEAGLIQIGTHAQVTAHGVQGEPIQAQVARFTNSLDLATRTMLTEIDVDNLQHRLYPRMYTTVTLDLVRHPDAIQLPAAAVEGVGEKRGYVFIVHDDSLIKQPVSLGITDGRLVEITSGLNGNESVVATISPALSQDEKVNPVQTSTTQGSNRVPQIASDR